ncbi:MULTISPECIES: IS3 family transposase [unclassified Streptomyces]|nr:MULTISPECIES: IS3 family transposase [unclassified Streptomyces]
MPLHIVQPERFSSNYRVYGARKIWRELSRQGHAVAR